MLDTADIIREHATVAEANWLDTYQRRKAIWESGDRAEPLGPVCRRYEIPRAEYHGGRVDPALLFELLRIDRGFEIIYDRFTSQEMGPGHHLYRRVDGDGNGSNDLLVWEVSLQWDMFRMWPEGRPRAPGFWFLPILKGNMRKTGETAEQRKQARIDRSKANRAKKIKTAFDAEMGAFDEIQPYLPVESGGNGRIIRRTGRDLIAKDQGPRVYSLPARDTKPEPKILVANY